MIEKIILIASLCAVFLSHQVRADVYRPTDENQVVARVRNGERTPRKEQGTFNEALVLARRYISQGRSEGDPRLFGRAEAVLGPWLNDESPAGEALVLDAMIREHRHDFRGALVRLNQALAKEPANAQAWLNKAIMHFVRGEKEQARASCLPLVRLSSELISMSCLSAAASMSGNFKNTFQALTQLIEHLPDAPQAEQVWAMSLAAELAERLGDEPQAGRLYQAALGKAPDDVHLLTAYADFLLQSGKPGEVLKLLAGNIRGDGLLLRLALAKRALDLDFAEDIKRLQASYTAEERRGEAVHLREQALFYLSLIGEPPRALPLALKNWESQREPIDLLILARAAEEAGEAQGKKIVQDWVKGRKYQDKRLEMILTGKR